MTTAAEPTVANLADDVALDWFRREVAVPGTFATLYPTTTDDDIAGALVDGFWKARLDGWLPTFAATSDTFTVTPALTMTALGVVIIYAGVRFVQNEIKNLPTHRKYDAPGGLGVETDYAPTVLTERLKELQQEKADLLEMARNPSGRRPSVIMHDGYAIRQNTIYPVNRPLPVLFQSPLALM